MEHNKYMDTIANSIRQTKLYEVVTRILGGRVGQFHDLGPEIATVVLLSAPARLFKDLSLPIRKEFKALVDVKSLPSELEKEILQLRYQIVNLTELCGNTDTCKQAQQCSHACEDDEETAI
jgi:hypothetical protein